MTVRTFTAETMKDALLQVREELGQSAVILHTKTIPRRRFFWMKPRQVVEVTASVGVNVASRAQPRRAQQLAAAYGQRPKAAPRTAPPRPAAAKPSTPPVGSGVASPDVTDPAVFEQLKAIRKMVEDLVDADQRRHSPDVPEGLFQAYTRMIENEVAEELARRLIGSLQETAKGDALDDPEGLDQQLLELVESLTPVAGPIRCEGGPKVVALVGPTGVGKTTTIAKLAAIYKLRHGLRVGLVTVDTYRIAAVDQLRRYADIIDVQLDVVNTADQLQQTLARMRQQQDLVLVDTAGRSPRDDLKIGELRTLIQAGEPDEIHLVLSLTASERHLQTAVEKFAGLGGEHMLLTKLDEAVTYGMVLGLVEKAGRKLSYLTTGQTVPDDIEIAKQDRLARLITGKETIHG